MKKLLLINVVVPVLLAAAFIATARDEELSFLFALGLGGCIVGLVPISLAAALVLWKRHGPRALAPLLTLLVVGACSVTGAIFGVRAVIAGTADSPDTFVRGATQRELETAGRALLAGEDLDRVEPTLTKHGLRVEVDSVRRVVSFKHFRGRTCFEYLFAPDGLSPAHTAALQLTAADFGNWGALRKIGDQSAPESSRPLGAITFVPEIAVPLMRRALGDSLLLELRSRANLRPIAPAEKALVIASLNAECRAESRLIEHPAITLEGSPAELHVGSIIISDAFWVAPLLRELIQQRVVKRAPDGRHMILRSSLTIEEQHRVAWLHAGLLNFICGELIDVRDHVYDRRLAEGWYVRES